MGSSVFEWFPQATGAAPLSSFNIESSHVIKILNLPGGMGLLIKNCSHHMCV